jgi:hypothetical protein
MTERLGVCVGFSVRAKLSCVFQHFADGGLVCAVHGTMVLECIGDASVRHASLDSMAAERKVPASREPKGCDGANTGRRDTEYPPERPGLQGRHSLAKDVTIVLVV